MLEGEKSGNLSAPRNPPPPPGTPKRIYSGDPRKSKEGLFNWANFQKPEGGFINPPIIKVYLGPSVANFFEPSGPLFGQ